MPLEDDPSGLILLVTGSTLRAEICDRRLAYRLRRAILRRLPEETVWEPVVISDIWYLNSESLQNQPTISVGGPGVNAVSQLFYSRLPTRLGIDGVLLIQMDAEMQDQRCCVWGMDHERTVEAVRLFVKRGYLDEFLTGIGAA